MFLVSDCPFIIMSRDIPSVDLSAVSEMITMNENSYNLLWIIILDQLNWYIICKWRSVYSNVKRYLFSHYLFANVRDPLECLLSVCILQERHSHASGRKQQSRTVLLQKLMKLIPVIIYAISD